MNSLINLLLAAKRALSHVMGSCAPVALQNGYQPSPAFGCSYTPSANIGMHQGWFKSTR
jgi:hypothetical protein